jgi:glycosyltransferase involved in cell wall biosynthesis
VHNSIDPAPFAEPMDISYLREELNLPDNALFVGTLAHLAPRKGHKDLLAAIPSILKSVPNACFLWAGRGVLEDELKSQVNDMGLADNVRFLGYRKDAPALHRLFDVFVLPSYIEGLPLVLLEAMACAKPCVATNVAGSPELVVAPPELGAGGHDETGFLVNPRDPGALAHALATLLLDENLRRQMGQAGRRRVEQHFTLADAVKKLRTVYHKEIERQTKK